jgi:parallel beta-helix repeat protein
MRASWWSQTIPAALIVSLTASAVVAETLRVPRDHKSIQSAIDAAKHGDTVLVDAGTYRERLRLRAGITIKSVGDDAKGKLGLRRAEATIIDGDFKNATGAGVVMAEDSVLDGFTITGVGQYDEVSWKKHQATLGEEQSHEHIGAAGTAGIAVVGITRCTVRDNIVHHVGYTGIAITGTEGKRVSPHVFRNVTYRNMGGGIGSMKKSTAIIESNLCFENFYAGIGHNDASPLVIDNTCHSNIRAGIGISEGASPVVQGNKCYANRRAGIGIRSGESTQPIVEDNTCYENQMAGIGNRDGARPIIRRNRCFRNRMAGIGSRDGARAVIEENECFENEMAGIGSRLGAAPIIRGNRCYRNLMAGIGAREGARPVIEDNECFENRMAGIGTQQDAVAVIRGNRCHHNQMAGIGSRLGARPVIVDNDCHDNQMAGVGSREGAAAVIRGNRSFKNQMAGFGNRRGARSVLVDNEARENRMAGIGVRDKLTTAVIIGNRCLENRLVAVGLPDGATGFIHGNELLRTGGGAPPLVAVKGGSRGVVSYNSISGGGVAGVLVQGNVEVIGNRFQGKGPGQGSAIWVWKGSQLRASGNHVDGYRNAINASGSQVTAVGNITRAFQGPSIIVRKPSAPSRVHGNTAISRNPKDTATSVDGTVGLDGDNVIREPKEDDETGFGRRSSWPLQTASTKGDAFHRLARTGERVEVRQGPWRLVVTYGPATTYQLFNIEDDPQGDRDLAEELEQICFRLRGVIERQQGLEFQAEMRGKKPRPSLK